MSHSRGAFTAWDLKGLELAAFVSRWSKDPSTQVGAAILDPNQRVVSVGFNGFPVGFRDLPERLQDQEFKLNHVVHGEMNAILFAGRCDLFGCTLYIWPFLPCSRCAAMIVQTGIRRVVAPKCQKEPGHWMYESIDQTMLIFNEVGVEVHSPVAELASMFNLKVKL